MALVNEATNEITVKLVYYGPPHAGKTTNLRWIEEHVPARTKGKPVELTTEGDTTLFFGFVPLAIGTVGDRRARIQLYAVPGHVRHEASLRLVLRGCDGIVFVADSQAAMLDANVESLRGLQQNLPLSELDLSLPQVIQYNKRDTPTALPLSVLEAELNPRGLPHFEAVAIGGSGVEETLRGIMSLLAVPLAGAEGQGQPRVPTPQRRAIRDLASAEPGVSPALAARPSSPITPERSATDAAPLPDGERLTSGQWLALLDGQERGPLAFDDLVDLALAHGADALKVWRAGFYEWVVASQLAAIADEIPPPIPKTAAFPLIQGDEDMPDFDTVPHPFRTVLIADEDASYRGYLAMPLAAQGFTIYEAADGAAAWQLAVKNRPWMILADVSMPEVDGFEFCRRVRGHPLLSRRPLLFISGSDKYRDRYRALQTGADDFLSKNMPVRELLIRIQLLMTRYSDIDAPDDRQGSAASAAVFQGRVEALGAPALVQICHERGLTGVLSVARDAEHGGGLLSFREGEIVSARVDTLVGVDAVYAFLAWERGDFRFTPGDPEPGAPLAPNVEQLLLEACRRIEASRRGAVESA